MGQEEAEARKMEEERQDRRSEERGKKRREELTKQQTMVSNTIEPIRSETSSLIGPQQSSGASTTSAKLSVPMNDHHHDVIMEDVPIDNKRQVERFVWKPRTPKTTFIANEGFPDWLLSVRRCDWAEIGISELQAIQLQQICPKIFDQLDSILKIIPKSEEVMYLRSVDVFLCSGSVEFVENCCHFLQKSTPIIAIFTGVSRIRRRLHEWDQWTYKHSKVGGVTSCRITMGFRGLAPIKLGEFVTRSLGHVLQHKERPKVGFANGEGVYRETNLLEPTCLERPILYPTHMCYTGWGKRQLTAVEIADAFDLPSWCDWNPGFQVPIKVCLEVLQGFLSDLETTVDSPEPMQVAPAPTYAPKHTWLPQFQRFLPGSWADPNLISAKAAKADNAKVATSMWDDRIGLIFPTWTPNRLDALRRGVLQWQCRRLYLEFVAYMRNRHGVTWLAQLRMLRLETCKWSRGSTDPTIHARKRVKGGSMKTLKDHPLLKDGAQGAQALSHFMRASWWNWDAGSTLFHWRWNTLQEQEWARDGMIIWIQGELPTTRVKQRRPPNDVIEKLAEKIDKMLAREYMELDDVTSLIEVFPVEKADDIRPVYNGTKSGLNGAVWAPSFFLPTSKSALRVMSYETFCVDMDLGEMFLNFAMTKELRAYAGVDITSMIPFLKNIPKDWKGDLFVRWNRQFMGFTPSPFNSVRSYYIAEEFARGNPRLEDNAMRYDRVIFNLPGDEKFDATKPRVMKWNDIAEAIAGDVKTFVDDLRGTGFSFENAWQVARQLTSRLQYLGIQDAPRKRRPSAQDPGAWAGAIFAIICDQLIKSVTQEKWDKGRAIIQELQKLVEEAKDGRPEINHKDLERKCGFLVHLAMTFGDIMPWLKEFYNSMNIWRPGRGEDGFKMTDKQWQHYVESVIDSGEFSEEEFAALMKSDAAPKMIKVTEGFNGALEALAMFMGPEEVPRVMVRANTTLHVFYGFGDASGKGLGSGIARSDLPHLSVRIGVWGYAESEEESSNWREFTNVVEGLEEEGEKGNLTNCIVFFFTDNSTVEAALYSGTSSSPKLLKLVIRFKALQSKYSVIVHVSHVAGTRMIVQGTDGISRGRTNEGVMAGEMILSFIPTHLSAIDRSPKVWDWIVSWIGQQALLLKPIEWFERGHDITGWKKSNDGFWRTEIESGVYVWAPPPAAADVALEELRVARIKRQSSTHIFVVPRLMTPEWLKQLYKASDIVFSVPVGQSFWEKDMHEPLLIGIVFPFIRCKPWQLRAVPKMYATNRRLSGLWEDSDVDAGSFLRKFCEECRSLDSMSEQLVRRVLYFESGAKVLCSHRGSDGSGPKRRRETGLQVEEDCKRRKGSVSQGATR